MPASAVRMSAPVVRADVAPRGRILYLTFDGLLEPLGQAQVVPFVERLAALGFRYTVVSLEKAADLADEGRVEALRERLHGAGIRWRCAPYVFGGGMRQLTRNWSAVFGLAGRELRHEQADLVHARAHVTASVAWVLRGLTRTPYLFDVRGYWVDEKVSERDRAWMRAAHGIGKAIERRLLRDAAGVVMLNEVIAGDLRRWCVGKPARVIPTCADYEVFSPEADVSAVPANVRAGLHSKIVVAWLGAVRPSYYVNESLQLFRHLRDLRADAHLLCITQQPEALEQALTLNGIPESAYTLAATRHDETAAWLRLARWGLLLLVERASSRGAMPTKLAEFLAAGVRVVQFGGNDAVRDAVRLAGNGIVLEDLSDVSLRRAAQQIAAAPPADDSAWRVREATRARFGLEAGVARYADVLEQMVTKRGRA